MRTIGPPRKIDLPTASCATLLIGVLCLALEMGARVGAAMATC